MVIPALQPDQRHRSPHRIHWHEYRKLVNRARTYLNNPVPTPEVPNAYNVPDIDFDMAAALWVQKQPRNYHGDGPYTIHATESKMKLIEDSLKGTTASFEAVLIGAPAVTYTITPNLNVMFNNPNLTVCMLAELDTDPGPHQGMPCAV